MKEIRWTDKVFLDSNGNIMYLGDTDNESGINCQYYYKDKINEDNNEKS